MRLHRRTGALRRWYSGLQFRQKLSIAFGLVILAPLATLAALSIRTLESSAMEKGRVMSEQYLGQSVSNVEGLLDYAVSIAKVVVADDRVQNYFAENQKSPPARRFEEKMLLQSFLDGIVEPKSNIASIVLYGDNGENVACTKVVESRLASYDDYVEQLAYMDAYWGMPVYLHSSRGEYERGRPRADYISVLKPIISSGTGAIVGIVEINYYEETIGQFLDMITRSTGAQAFVCDSQGLVVSATDKSLLNRPAGPGVLPDQAVPGGTRALRVGGVRRLVSTARLHKTGWVAVYSVPVRELLPEVRSQMALMVGYGFSALLMAALLSRPLIRSLTKPINRLVRSMDGASQGDLSVRVRVEGSDEFARLSSSFNSMIGRISDLMDRVANEQNQKRQSQLLALQAQINPHFLYNTLESICALIRLEQPRHAFDTVKSLETFYRTCLSDGKNVVSLTREFENVRSYLEIQKTRYHDRLAYRVDLDREVECCPVVKLTVQPLVENAIYHGTRMQPGMGRVAVRGYRSGDLAVVEVRDNGPGFTEECARQVLSENVSAGYGLYNVNERIKLHFGAQYGVAIDHTAAGGSVSVRVPLYMTDEGGRDDPRSDCGR